ncbi:TPA: autotransporter outer membrane beta-barrel domain-containing protein [Photobacterium damselae]
MVAYLKKTLLALTVGVTVSSQTYASPLLYTENERLLDSELLISSTAAGGADATEAHTLKFLYEQAKATDNKELLKLINSAKTDKERAQLAGELTPDRSGMTIKGALISQDLFARAIQRRTTDFVFGDAARSSFWGSYLGGSLEHYAATEGANRFDGFDADMHGFAFGFDKIVADSTVIGAAFSNQNVKANSRLFNKTVETDSYQAALYGTKTWDHLVIAGRTLVGWNSNITDREIGSAQNYDKSLDAHGRFNSFSTSVQLDIQSPIYWNNFNFAPIISARYSWIKAEEYKENFVRDYDKKGNLVLSSGSPAALEYDSQSYDEFNIGIGLVGGFNINSDVGVFTIRSGVYGDFEVLDSELTTTAKLASGGDKFTVSVNPYSKQQYRSFAEISLESNTSWSANIGGEYQWGDQQDGYLIFGKVVYSF